MHKMSRNQKCKYFAFNGDPKMSADYGIRAAGAMRRLLPSKHRNKAIETLFRCSPRMAKYLDAGQYWTIDRLNQASAALGAAFDVAMAGGEPDEQHISEMYELAEWLVRWGKSQNEAVVATLSSRLAPPDRVPADEKSDG